MADTTAIEWCDSTFNPWIGCTRVSPACDDCYAARSTPARTLGVVWGTGDPRRRTSAANWKQPELWQRQAAKFHAVHGRRRRVFCASLADVFDNEVPDEWRVDLFRLIAATPDLDWLLVTKRIGNVARMLGDYQTVPLLPNIWLGITVVNQDEADRDVPKLLRVPAAVRFLSVEPMLGPVDLTRIVLHSGPIELAATAPAEWHGVKTVNVVMDATRPGKQSGRRGIDWVICGGESGPKARQMQAVWAQSLRDQCAAASVPLLFKQWGQWLPAGQDGAHDHEPVEINASNEAVSIGKKAAGRLLDGRTHDEFPEAPRG